MVTVAKLDIWDARWVSFSSKIVLQILCAGLNASLLVVFGSIIANSSPP
jgi:hypothetical protein